MRSTWKPQVKKSQRWSHLQQKEAQSMSPRLLGTSTPQHPPSCPDTSPAGDQPCGRLPGHFHSRLYSGHPSSYSSLRKPNSTSCLDVTTSSLLAGSSHRPLITCSLNSDIHYGGSAHSLSPFIHPYLPASTPAAILSHPVRGTGTVPSKSSSIC